MVTIQRTARIAKRALDTTNNPWTPPRESAFKHPLETKRQLNGRNSTDTHLGRRRKKVVFKTVCDRQRS